MGPVPVEVAGGVEVGAAVHRVVACQEAGHIELGTDKLQVAGEGGVHQIAAAPPALGQVDVAVGVAELPGGTGWDRGWVGVGADAGGCARDATRSDEEWSHIMSARCHLVREAGMFGSDPGVDDTDDDVFPRLLLPPRTLPQRVGNVQEVGRVSGVSKAVSVGDHGGNLGVGSEEDGFGWGEGGCEGIQGVLVAAGWGGG